MPAGERAEPFDKKNAAERGRAGGKKSGETRRKKKELREWAGLLLNTKVTDEKLLKKFKAAGISSSESQAGAVKGRVRPVEGKGEDVTFGALITANMILTASGKGKQAVAAYKALLEADTSRAERITGTDESGGVQTGVVVMPTQREPEEPPEDDDDE